MNRKTIREILFGLLFLTLSVLLLGLWARGVEEEKQNRDREERSRKEWVEEQLELIRRTRHR